MNKTEKQLKAVAKQLQSLAQKVDRLAKLAAKPNPVKAKPKALPKTKGGARKAVVNKAGAKKGAERKQKGGAPTVLDAVYGVIQKAKKGISIADIKKKAGTNTRQLSNALYKLSKKGMIKTESRGTYILS